MSDDDDLDPDRFADGPAAQLKPHHPLLTRAIERVRSKPSVWTTVVFCGLHDMHYAGVEPTRDAIAAAATKAFRTGLEKELDDFLGEDR